MVSPAKKRRVGGPDESGDTPAHGGSGATVSAPPYGGALYLPCLPLPHRYVNVLEVARAALAQLPVHSSSDAAYVQDLQRAAEELSFLVQMLLMIDEVKLRDTLALLLPEPQPALSALVAVARLVGNAWQGVAAGPTAGAAEPSMMNPGQSTPPQSHPQPHEEEAAEALTALRQVFGTHLDAGSMLTGGTEGVRGSSAEQSGDGQQQHPHAVGDPLLYASSESSSSPPTVAAHEVGFPPSGQAVPSISPTHGGTAMSSFPHAILPRQLLTPISSPSELGHGEVAKGSGAKRQRPQSSPVHRVASDASNQSESNMSPHWPVPRLDAFTREDRQVLDEAGHDTSEAKSLKLEPTVTPITDSSSVHCGDNTGTRQASPLKRKSITTKQLASGPGALSFPTAKALAHLERGHPTRKANPRRWTKEEDDALRKAVELHNEKNWKAIAAMVPGRNHTQCLQRWTKVLAPGLVKGHWSPQEDELLRQLVASEQKNWGEVAAKIPGRTSKQCRERWHNHLDPSIVRGAYTPEEDRIILEAQARLGNRWSVIAAMLPGRTEDAVKIRWKSHCRLWKTRKYMRKSSGAEDDQSEGQGQYDEEGDAMAAAEQGTKAHAQEGAQSDLIADKTVSECPASGESASSFSPRSSEGKQGSVIA